MKKNSVIVSWQLLQKEKYSTFEEIVTQQIHGREGKTNSGPRCKAAGIFKWAVETVFSPGARTVITVRHPSKVSDAESNVRVSVAAER